MTAAHHLPAPPWRRGARDPRFWIAILSGLALAAALALATPAVAQDDASEAGDDAPTPVDTGFDDPFGDLEVEAGADSLHAADADTTRAPGDLGGDGDGGTETGQAPPRLAYNTKYTINRASQNWEQTLAYNEVVNDLTIASSASAIVDTETTLNRDQRNRSFSTKLTYKPYPDLALASQFQLTRNVTDNARSDNTLLETDLVTLSADYTRTLLPGLKGTFGVDGRGKLNRRDDPNTSNQESDGPEGEARALFAYEQGITNVTLHTSTGGARFKTLELDTGLRTVDANRRNAIRFDAEFKPPRVESIKLNASRDHHRTQAPYRVSEELAVQETSTNLQRGLGIDVLAKPIERMTLTGRASFRGTDISRSENLSASQESEHTDLGGEVRYLFPDSTSVSTKASLSSQRVTYDQLTRQSLNGDTETAQIAGSLQRPLTKTMRFLTRGSYQVRKIFFDDVTNLNERDVVNVDFDATLTYNPMRKMRTSVKFVFSHAHTISLDASQSGANQTQQTFRVTPTLTYDITPRIKFTEDASVIANARVFDFDENSNTLARTTEFRSGIETTLSRKLLMKLRHVHRLTLNGSYSRESPGAPRKFGKSNDALTGDLTARFEYRPLRAKPQNLVYFDINRRRGNTIETVFRSGGFVDEATNSEYTQIQTGTTVNYPMKIGPTVSVDMRRIQNWNQSGRRNNYWQGNISVQHRF